MDHNDLKIGDMGMDEGRSSPPTLESTNLSFELAADLFKAYANIVDTASAIKFYKMWQLYLTAYPEDLFVQSFSGTMGLIDEKYEVFKNLDKHENL